MQYNRITRSQAKKLFAENKVIYLIPHKMRIGSMWHIECPVNGINDYIDSAKQYEKYFNERSESNYAKQYSKLWKGSLLETAWALMYNNWSFHNTNYEMGYYAHYYVLR